MYIISNINKVDPDGQVALVNIRGGLCPQDLQKFIVLLLKAQNEILLGEILDPQAADLAVAQPRQHGVFLRALEALDVGREGAERPVGARRLHARLQAVVVREAVRVLAAEAALQHQPRRRAFLVHPAARLRGVGEPDAQQLEIRLREEAATVVHAVDTEDARAGHGAWVGIRR